MTDKEKLKLIKEAVKNVSDGSLSEGAFVFVIAGIVNGLGKITKKDIAWAKKSIKEHPERYKGEENGSL
jgi:hypothetical protein